MVLSGVGLSERRNRNRSYSRSSMRSFSLFGGLLFLICHVLIATKSVAAAPYNECYQHIYDALQAGGGGALMDENEYLNAVQRITYGGITNLTIELEQVFGQYKNGQGVFWVSGVAPDDDPPPVQRAFLDSFCQQIYAAVLDSEGKTVNTAQCLLWMSLADRWNDAKKKDDRLEKEEEFPNYANRMTLSENLYGESASFESLPVPLQRVYDDFEDPNDPGFVNVTGSWLFPGESVEQEQTMFLDSLCLRTEVAILAGKALELQEQPTSAPAGPREGPFPDFEFTFGTCVSSMVLSDLVVDNILTQPEYVGFINKLTENYFEGLSFKNLPESLKQSYTDKVVADGTNGVSIEGARFNSIKTNATITALEQFCDATQVALSEANSITTAPTGPPASMPDNGAYEIPFSKCTISMATSEAGVRNDVLNEAEYVTFLNKATDYEFFRDMTFSQLEQPLVDNYNALSTSLLGIPIAGSFPGLPRSGAQNASLMEACSATSTAVDEVVNPKPSMSPSLSPAPSASPTTSGTSSSGTVTIFNAFVTSNTAGLGVANLTSGDVFSALSQGYRAFAQSIIGTTGRRFLKSSNLRLLPATGVVEGSAALYQIEDFDCPSSVTASEAVCHIVFGRLAATFVDEDNAAAFIQATTQAIQNSVSRNNNGLQSFLDTANPDTQVRIVGVPDNGRVQPLQPLETDSPTPSPFQVDTKNTNEGDGDNDNGLSAGVIVAIVLIILLCCCLGCFLFQRHKNGQDLCCCSMPAVPTMPRRKRDDKSNATDDDSQQPEDPEMAAVPPAMAVTENQLGMGLGIFEVHDDSHKDEEGTTGFNIQEQSPLQSPTENEETSANVFGAFGRGGRRGSLGMNNLRRNSDDGNNSALGPSVGSDNRSGSRSNRSGDVDYRFDDTNSMQKSHDSISKSAAPDWDPQRSREDPNWGYDENDDEEEETSDEDGEEVFEDEEGDGTETSGDDTYRGSKDDETLMTSALPGNIKQFNSLVESGDWDGVMMAAANFEQNDDDDSYARNRRESTGFSTISGSRIEEEGGEEEDDEESDSDSEETSEASKSRDTSADTSEGSYSEEDSKNESGISQDASVDPSSQTLTSEELRRREKYLHQVEELVKKVVPDEADNVESMMDQFAGREEELINTLQTMYERSYSVRARKAIHKSNPIDTSNSGSSGRFASSGGAEGSAVVAAASTIGVGFERPMEDFDSQQDEEDVSEEDFEGEEAEFEEDEEEGDYEDEEEGDFEDDEEEEGDYEDEDEENEDEENDFEDEGQSFDESQSIGEGSESSSGSYENDPEDEQFSEQDLSAQFESSRQSGSYFNENGEDENSFDDEDSDDYEDDE